MYVLSFCLQTYRASVSAIFDRIRMGHIIVFVMSMLGGILVMLGMFRPYLRQAGKETRQIAEMLSQLPPEMDVEGLIRQALAYAQGNYCMPCASRLPAKHSQMPH